MMFSQQAQPASDPVLLALQFSGSIGCLIIPVGMRHLTVIVATNGSHTPRCRWGLVLHGIGITRVCYNNGLSAGPTIWRKCLRRSFPHIHTCIDLTLRVQDVGLMCLGVNTDTSRPNGWQTFIARNQSNYGSGQLRAQNNISATFIYLLIHSSIEILTKIIFIHIFW